MKLSSSEACSLKAFYSKIENVDHMPRRMHFQPISQNSSSKLRKMSFWKVKQYV